MLSRRKLITAGATAGAVSLLSPVLTKVAPAQTGGAQSGSVSDYLSVTHSSDPSFASKLNMLFPGLLNNPIFQKIQPHAVLISNVSNQTISAYSTLWKVTTPTGGYETIMRHYFHRVGKSHRSAHFGRAGNRTRFAGEIPLFRAGQTRLVTPYFNWSPSCHRKNPKPNWKKILSESASRQFFLHELSNQTGTQVSVDALIVNKHTLVGSDIGELGKTFSMTRNAEHDEAISVRHMIANGTPLDVVANQLRSHASGKLPPAFQNAPRLYKQVRMRQATVLLRRMEHATPEQFTRTLKYVAHKSKTTFPSSSLG